MVRRRTIHRCHLSLLTIPARGEAASRSAFLHVGVGLALPLIEFQLLTRGYGKPYPYTKSAYCSEEKLHTMEEI